MDSLERHFPFDPWIRIKNRTIVVPARPQKIHSCDISCIYIQHIIYVMKPVVYFWGKST